MLVTHYSQGHPLAVVQHVNHSKELHAKTDEQELLTQVRFKVTTVHTVRIQSKQLARYIRRETTASKLKRNKGHAQRSNTVGICWSNSTCQSQSIYPVTTSKCPTLQTWNTEKKNFLKLLMNYCLDWKTSSSLFDETVLYLHTVRSRDDIGSVSFWPVFKMNRTSRFKKFRNRYRPTGSKNRVLPCRISSVWFGRLCRCG